MANIVISGDSSGAVTLQAPAVAGTTTLTLPTTSGTLVVTGGAQTVQFAAGSAASPSITFTGDTNTGIFSPTADTIAFSEGGVESMRIDSSGNVGIGTSSPRVVSGYKNLTLDGSTSGLFEINTNGTRVFSLYGASNDINLVNPTATGTMQFYTNNTERMRIDSVGQLHLGNTTPTDGHTSSSQFFFGITGTLYSQRTTALGLPGTHILENQYVNQSTGYYVYNTTGTASRISLDGNTIRFVNSASGTAGTAISETERMRLTSGGSLLIGSNVGVDFRLRVAGSNAASFGDDYDSTVYGAVQIVRPGSQGNAFHLAFIRGGFKVAGMGFLNNSDTFAIQNTSNNTGSGVTLGNAATSWGTTSDERKKDIIAPIEDALTKLADWRSVYYKYKNDEADAPQRVGLIAQDVQATLPEAVSVEDDEIKTLQLRYTETIPLLVKAIQELNAKVEAQAAEIAALKGAN